MSSYLVLAGAVVVLLIVLGIPAITRQMINYILNPAHRFFVQRRRFECEGLIIKRSSVGQS